jgi:uroporphyrin-III C-methyltransferase
VLYMAVGQAAQIAGILETQGMPASTPVVLVENASLPGSRHVGTTLRGLRNGFAPALTGPALLLFGDVFRRRAHSLIGAELMDGDTPLRAIPG